MGMTYPQEWHEYNLAQVNEKSRFLELLYALTNGTEPPTQTFGRPRLPFDQMIFCAAFKVYSGFSSRRFSSDLREALAKGYISKAPHFNSVSNYLDDERMTPYLRRMIVESSLPLKCVEDDFAVDSSGFAVGSGKKTWHEAKWGWMRDEFGTRSRQTGYNSRDWIKVHVMCGCTTNVITSVEVTPSNLHDSPQFTPLVEATAANFVMNSVCADKAYSSEKNLKLVLSKQAMPYIPFKSPTTGKTKGETWRQMYHFFQYNREAFNASYHRRSNVETVFSMIKRKFGERLRSKTTVAQTNEVLCKVLCHNLCCVIQSIYELGIEPTFWTD